MKAMKKIGTLLVCLILVISLFGTGYQAAASADDMIYCPECGKKIDAGSKFCMYCGHPIPVASQSADSKPVATPAPSVKPSSSTKVDSFYVIGSSENTFAGLYKRMCVNLDLKKNPIPEPDEDMGNIGDETLHAKVLKDDSESYEYIGYCRGRDGTNRYICWSWVGDHQDGSTIAMLVFYTADGKYLGNIQRDLTAGTSTSSSRCPYYIPGEPLNKA